MRRPSHNPHPSPSRGRRPVLLAGVAAAVLVVAVLVLVVGTRGPDQDDGPTATCRSLGGDLRIAGSGAFCDVARTAFQTESVRLAADGSVDPADGRRRRARCATDARSARDRALALARTRGADAFDTFRWSSPGVCRSAPATLPAAAVARARASFLLDRAERAVQVDPGAALALAQRADRLAGDARSRAAIARARAALRPAEPRPSTQLVSPNEYLGIDCASIGRAFRVAPGSDPAHDPDGDGRACEGQ